MRSKLKIAKRKRSKSYEKMMKTLLLQNQQIIMQQHNMMFMVMKQLHPNQLGSLMPTGSASATIVPEVGGVSTTASAYTTTTSSQVQSHLQQQSHQQIPPTHHLSSHNHQLQAHHHNHNLHQQQHHHSQQQLQQQQLQQQSQHQHEGHQIYSQGIPAATAETQQELNDISGNYLTPAASEQDPITDKQDEDDLAAFLDGDGLLQNNLLYNPQTDIGSITPFKNQQPQQQTPSYYSSGCESLTTPRIDQQRNQQRQQTINQNIVKNLADSFKSPTKPKINVQILPGSATGTMKNSKAKIIQRMNISEFLRHVHPENDEKPTQISQSQ